MNIIENNVLIKYDSSDPCTEDLLSVVKIGNGAFSCSEIEIIPELLNCEVIDTLAFDSSSITEAVIPPHVVSIREHAFLDCTHLKHVFIPASVEEIAANSFEGCSSLNRFDVDENNLFFSSAKGILYNKDKTQLIKFPAGKRAKNYVLPDSVARIMPYSLENTFQVENISIFRKDLIIDPYGFSSADGLHSIDITGIEKINEGAFSFSSIESIHLSNHLKEIPEKAFESCQSLKQITLPDSLEKIGTHAFSNSGLYTITVPSKVAVIEPFTFASSSLTRVELLGVKEIQKAAFAGCQQLKEIAFPANIESINDFAFNMCFKLKAIRIPTACKIGEKAFGDLKVEIIRF